MTGRWPRRFEPVREAAERPVLDEHQRQAAVADQAGERHGERRQTDHRHPERVVESAQQADPQREQQRDLGGDALVDRPREQDRGQAP